VHGLSDSKRHSQSTRGEGDLRKIFQVVRKPVIVSTAEEKKRHLGRDLVLMIARDLLAFDKVHSEGFVDFMKVVFPIPNLIGFFLIFDSK